MRWIYVYKANKIETQLTYNYWMQMLFPDKIDQIWRNIG